MLFWIITLLEGTFPRNARLFGTKRLCCNFIPRSYWIVLGIIAIYHAYLKTVQKRLSLNLADDTVDIAHERGLQQLHPSSPTLARTDHKQRRACAESCTLPHVIYLSTLYSLSVSLALWRSRINTYIRWSRRDRDKIHTGKRGTTREMVHRNSGNSGSVR